MSRFNKKNALAVKEITEFEGIDTRFPADGKGKTKEMFNYRILKDGSIKKRSGIRFVTSFEGQIRAIWTGYVKDRFTGYVLVKQRVYQLNYGEDGEFASSTYVGDISTSTGDADIFYYRDYFFILDGLKIYCIVNDAIKVANGYAPLYGKDWPTGEVGEVYEPMNVLTSRARITYVVTDPPNIFLCTDQEVESVQNIYVNGNYLHSSNYEIDNKLRTINIPLLSAGDRIEVHLTFKSTGNNYTSILNSTRATVFGGMNNSRVFLWGENSNELFVSSYVPESSLQRSGFAFGEDSILYFTYNNDIRVGDGNKCIKGVSRHYDRLLVFTEAETWMADSSYCDNEAVPIMRINSQHGACSEGGIARCVNDPISVDTGKILRWRSNTDELDDCNAYCISEEINDILPTDFFWDTIAIEDKFHGEVLFAKKRDDEGKIYVYQEKNNNWYIYDKISADGFYEGRNNVGVYIGDSMYIFDDLLEYDIDEEGNEKTISAYLSTYPMDFGLPYDKKRLSAASLLLDSDGDEMKLSFTTDNGRSKEITIADNDCEYVSTYTRRLQSERFIRVSMRLESSLNSNQRIYRIGIAVKH